MTYLSSFIKSICFICLLIFLTGFTERPSEINSHKTSFNKKPQDTILMDTVSPDSSLVIYIPYKESVHASYYHDKFNGRRTASGERFDNNLYTAAHKTLAFGTKVKVTNPVNNQFVIVTINDRGPFIKNREIDLSKKAFMAITNQKLPGFIIVHLEILKE